MIGSSVYAFSLMLTAFILGLAAGSMIYARFADRARHPLLILGVIEMAIGLSALCVVPIFGELPFFVTKLIAQIGGAFWRLHAAEFVLVLLIMLVPTTLMGAAFPLAARIAIQSPAAVVAHPWLLIRSPPALACMMCRPAVRRGRGDCLCAQTHSRIRVAILRSLRSVRRSCARSSYQGFAAFCTRLSGRACCAM